MKPPPFQNYYTTIKQKPQSLCIGIAVEFCFFELYSLRAVKVCDFRALRASLCECTTLAGATFAASLTSELADSALLGYLRHRRFAATAQSWQISPSPPKSKNTAGSNEHAVFWDNNNNFDTKLLSVATFARTVRLFTVVITIIF